MVPSYALSGEVTELQPNVSKASSDRRIFATSVFPQLGALEVDGIVLGSWDMLGLAETVGLVVGVL